MAEEKTTQLLCCRVHCRVQNVSHVCHVANQTAVQLIACIAILSVLCLHPGEIHVLSLLWVSLSLKHTLSLFRGGSFQDLTLHLQETFHLG